MIAQVDEQRADLGAVQNRLESSIRNQSNISTNKSDALSRIRDANFAEESANLSQQSIIQQAAAHADAGQCPPTAGPLPLRLKLRATAALIGFEGTTFLTTIEGISSNI